MSAGLEASTVTPGSTAPEESFTTPASVACASASEGVKTTTRTIAVRSKRKRLTGPLPPCIGLLPREFTEDPPRQGGRHVQPVTRESPKTRIARRRLKWQLRARSFGARKKFARPPFRSSNGKQLLSL